MQFILKNSRFLGFGFFVAFLSSFGQTYFIGVFRPAIVEAYTLSNSEFGFYYLIITLGSALGLNQLGHIVDRTELPRYVALLIILMAGACAFMFFAGHFWLLVLALLCVRLLGQGLLTHAAMTSMSRYFDKKRGLAVAVAGLGFPFGQAVLPPLAVLLMTLFSWQEAWLIFAVGLVVVALPLALWLLGGHSSRHHEWLMAQSAEDQNMTVGGVRHARRADVLKDKRFYFMLPALIAGPFWITAIFFFASDVAVMKAFSVADFTRFYGFYALGSVAAPFAGGTLVDRFGGKRLLWIYPPLFGLAMLVILLQLGGFGVVAFMMLLGLGAGITLPINNAVWAEMYGTRYLGEIKALSTSLVVVSTALAPFLIGLLLDADIALQSILMAGAAYCFIATAIVMPVTRAKI